MSTQIGFQIFANVITMLLICVLATLGGKQASKILTGKYENWRNGGGAVKQNPGSNLEKRDG